MAKIDLEVAYKTLLIANNQRERQRNDIGNAIDSIIRGSHKTYRYILVTALLAKSANGNIDIFSLQAGDSSEGSFDARSLCHKVLVPFERKFYPNALGGSNEPYLNKPARFTRISKDNAVKPGNDKRALDTLVNVLSLIQSSEQAREYLSSALYTISSIYDSIEAKYILPDLEIENDTNPQTIFNYINELIKVSYEGEICPLVVSAIEHIYYNGSRIVVPHKVNESGSSSKEIGDIDIFDSAEMLVSSIEVKDKDFTREDVEHAITKFGFAELEKTLFIYGKNVRFENDEVYKTASVLGQKGYFCSVISIDNFARLRLYSLTQKVSLQSFVGLLLEYARKINAKDETVMWIKNCAVEFAL